MERKELKAYKRDTGKSVSRKLRNEDKIPAILYGANTESTPICVDRGSFNQILKTDAGWNILIDLQVESGDKYLTRINDYQSDVLTRFMTHIDFEVLDLKKKIKSEVPIRLIGEPKGTEEGGVLEQTRRTLEIYCLPTNIPGHIDIDVSELEIGSSIHIEDVKLPEGVECDRETNFSIAALVAPTEEIEPEEALEEAAEPSLVGEEGEEAAAEGEEKAEGEGEKAEKEGEGEGEKEEAKKE